MVMYCHAPRQKDDLPSLPSSPPKEDRPQAELPLPDCPTPEYDSDRPKYNKNIITIVDIGGDSDLVPDANNCGPNVFSMF